MYCVLLKDLETNEHSNQTNYLIIQNKGTFYKALDLKKVNNIIMILYYLISLSLFFGFSLNMISNKFVILI